MDDDELVDLVGLELPRALLGPEVPPPDPSIARALHEVEAQAPERFEPDGWRVVAEADDQVTVAAFAPGWDGWVVTTLRREADAWIWTGTISYGVQPRPPARVRGQGFALELVEASLRSHSGSAPQVRVRLINRSAPRWRHPAAWYAAGSLVDPRTAERLGGGRHFFVTMQAKLFDLAPGQSVELPVIFDVELSALDPGDHAVTATYRELGLQARGDLHIDR